MRSHEQNRKNGHRPNRVETFRLLQLNAKSVPLSREYRIRRGLRRGVSFLSCETFDPLKLPARTPVLTEIHCLHLTISLCADVTLQCQPAGLVNVEAQDLLRMQAIAAQGRENHLCKRRRAMVLQGSLRLAIRSRSLRSFVRSTVSTGMRYSIRRRWTNNGGIFVVVCVEIVVFWFDGVHRVGRCGCETGSDSAVAARTSSAARR